LRDEVFREPQGVVILSEAKNLPVKTYFSGCLPSMAGYRVKGWGGDITRAATGRGAGVAAAGILVL